MAFIVEIAKLAVWYTYKQYNESEGGSYSYEMRGMYVSMYKEEVITSVVLVA